jgi:uncharacterized protein
MVSEQGTVSELVMEKMRARGEAGRVAVVGASADSQKYGNIIVRNLLSKGYEVVPINPREESIEGLKSYSSLLAVDVPVGIVDFVVPPAVTLAVLKEITGSSFDTVWFQDGSFNDLVIEYATEHFENVVHHACIMVVASTL